MHQYMLGDYTSYFNDPNTGLFKGSCSSDATYPIIYQEIIHGSNDEKSGKILTLGERAGLSAIANNQFKAGHIRYKMAVDEVKSSMASQAQLQGSCLWWNTFLMIVLVAAWSYWSWLCGLKYRFAAHNWLVDGNSW